MEAEVHEDNQEKKVLEVSQESQEVLDLWENEVPLDHLDHLDHLELTHLTMELPDEMGNQVLLAPAERLVTQV